MPHEFKCRVIKQMRDINLAACKEIIETNDLITFVQESFAKVRSDKPGSAGDENSHIRFHHRDTESTESKPKNLISKSVNLL